MIRLAAVVRGMLQRGGTTVMILAVALVATAAAAAGPIYYQAARTSILRDTVAGAGFSGRGYEANETGAVPGLLGQLVPAVRGQLGHGLGGLAGQGLFAPPVEALETALTYPQYETSIPLVWRGGVCGQLRISGRCPATSGQVLVSRRTAALTGWHLGQRVHFAGWPAFTITGLYRTPDQGRAYWFGRGSIYFSAISPLDALFTPRATLEQGPPQQQGTAVVDDLLNGSRLTGGEVPRLASAMTAFSTSTALQEQQVLVITGIPATLQAVQASWRSVEIPVVLITAQLLAACLLLLFLSVTDAIDARGHEVSLAKLRGRGGWRTIVFGMSEPVLLLAVALPAGTLAGWAATAALCHVLLRPGTAVVLPPLAWATAFLATAGGLLAVVLAARRTLRRPVVEEWRRSGRSPAGRGWVIDAVLATGAAAGLLELAVSGQIGSARRGVLGLLVPGLLGLAVAVIASRLLPLACRAAFARTGTRGGLGLFLALRHVARRPGGTRTTIVLATAFALSTFAVTAWTVGRGNEHLVAAAEVGAPTVLTVGVPPGRNLGAIVDRADPGGRRAAAVDRYTSTSSGTAGLTMLAVDPQRFARVAAWRPGYASEPLTELARELAPPAPAAVVLRGSAVRITVNVRGLSPAGSLLSADVATGASPVSLGPLPAHGPATLTGSLTGCPCVLRDLDLSPPPQALQSPVSGSITITGVQVRGRSGWVPAAAGLLSAASRWRPGHVDDPPDQLTASAAGLTWKFAGRPHQGAVLLSANRPYPLPAVVSGAMLSHGQRLASGVGLDGSALDLRVIAAASVVPGTPQSGVIVDRRYAELAAGESFPDASQEVWLGPGAQGIVEPRLKAAGLRILSVRSAGSVAAGFARQGPALASVLFLADAAAAALLAAGAAILGLYLSARRRRYEYAALSASGVRRGTLRRAVLSEMGLVLGFGVFTGIGAGLLAAVLALRTVPEFVTTPALPLSYVPAAAPLVVLLGVAVVLLAAAAGTAGLLLIRSVSLDQLRETPT
ncbi:MAG: FtsX-like permease family protein [Streptosporangiaceae bacterium]